MHRHQWIIFLSNFILYRDFTSRYISYRTVYSILVGAGYICIYMCIYVYVYIRIYLCAYVYVCICLRMHVTMYTWSYVCLLCVLILCMLILWCFFYLWLLGQRWPNKEVQTKQYFVDKGFATWHQGIRKLLSGFPHVYLYTVSRLVTENQLFYSNRM